MLSCVVLFCIGFALCFVVLHILVVIVLVVVCSVVDVGRGCCGCRLVVVMVVGLLFCL